MSDHTPHSTHSSFLCRPKTFGNVRGPVRYYSNYNIINKSYNRIEKFVLHSFKRQRLCSSVERHFSSLHFTQLELSFVPPSTVFNLRFASCFISCIHRNAYKCVYDQSVINFKCSMRYVRPSYWCGHMLMLNYLQPITVNGDIALHYD